MVIHCKVRCALIITVYMGAILLKGWHDKARVETWRKGRKKEGTAKTWFSVENCFLPEDLVTHHPMKSHERGSKGLWMDHDFPHPKPKEIKPPKRFHSVLTVISERGPLFPAEYICFHCLCLQHQAKIETEDPKAVINHTLLQRAFRASKRISEPQCLTLQNTMHYSLQMQITAAYSD